MGDESSGPTLEASEAGPDDQAPRPAATLLDALAGEGEYVGEGAFTLDPEQARAKLRDYALDEPEAWVLLIVEAAWLAGLGGIRSQLRVSCGSTTTLEFTSLAIDAAALANVIGAVFGTGDKLEGEERARHRTLQKLGLALNAALALEPKRLVVEHQDPSGSLLRLVLAGEGAGAAIERETHNAGGKRPLTRVVFGGSAFDLRRPARERQLLTTRARYANFIVLLDDERISGGLNAAFSPAALQDTPPIAVATAEPRKIIGAALRDQARLSKPGQLLLVTRGVLAETLEHFDPGLVAIVDVDLRKDLSQRQVVRDEAFDLVMAAVYNADEAIDLPEPEPEPEPGLTVDPGEAFEAHQRTQKTLGWAFGLLALFSVVVVLYTEIIGSEPPLEPGETWRGRTQCGTRRVTLTLHVSADRRKGTLTIEGRPEYESVQRVRLSGDSLDSGAFEVKHRGWDSKPAADFGPLTLDGWTTYGSLTAFIDGEDCEIATLDRIHGY